jgi:hypothetical protein
VFFLHASNVNVEWVVAQCVRETMLFNNVHMKGNSMHIKAGTIKRIHVDKHVIASNLKHGTDNPPITIQTSKGSYKCRAVDIKGPSRFVYRPTKPLSCGARLWIETHAEVDSSMIEEDYQPEDSPNIARIA